MNLERVIFQGEIGDGMFFNFVLGKTGNLAHISYIPIYSWSLIFIRFIPSIRR